MADIESKDVSGPLRYLLSLDFGLNYPLQVASECGVESKKKVRFADPQIQETNYYDSEVSGYAGELVSHSNEKIKGILKNKNSLDENHLEIFNLTASDPLQDDYSEDFSSLEEYVSEEYSKQKVAEKQQHAEADRESMSTEYFIKTNNCSELVNSSNNKKLNHVCEVQNNKSVSYISDSTNAAKIQSIEKFGDDTSYGSMPRSNVLQKFIYMQKKPRLIISCPWKIHEYGDHVRNLSSAAKPKVHFCIISSLLEDVPNGAERGSKKNHETISGNACHVHSYKSTESNWLPQHTIKLRQFLKDTLENGMCAKELRMCAFNSWCKVKKEAKLLSPEKRDLKNLVSATCNKKTSEGSSNAFVQWKLKKEEHLKMKKKKKSTPKTVSSSVHSEASNVKMDDSKDMAYSSWKSRKETELKELRAKNHRKENMEKINSIKQKETQKLQADLAFKAWSGLKQQTVSNQKGSKKTEAETIKLKVEQKEERKKEAEEAYVIWLQQKDKKYLNSHGACKPPWNPPG